MRSTTLFALALALVLLPGCVFAVGGRSTWDENEPGTRMSRLEKRVTALEKHVDACCSKDCANCEAGGAKADG